MRFTKVTKIHIKTQNSQKITTFTKFTKNHNSYKIHKKSQIEKLHNSQKKSQN